MLLRSLSWLFGLKSVNGKIERFIQKKKGGTDTDWVISENSNKLFSIIPPYEFDGTIAKRVTPLTVVYVGMLALNNLCLKHVEATFYQVCQKKVSVVLFYL